MRVFIGTHTIVCERDISHVLFVAPSPQISRLLHAAPTSQVTSYLTDATESYNFQFAVYVKAWVQDTL